ncbi:carbohydrate ABC transporter permease [Halocella sp. SP3-1]|uniref:carbohydrate ABC transporter permease n=1 Tax=Halocella sp. SP3-1 TaxID=2382161 RepID=UPI000F75F244|nr:carbohydrate ABC transporter permease [Halocella sp. SP3-1]AZO96466.1 carbohydrate ABC transporter permease [Halocella sp. SP3-1]
MILAKNKKLFYYLILVLIVIVFFFNVGPYLWILITSLKGSQEINRIPPTLIPEKLDLGSYITVLKETTFLLNIRNSFIIAFFAAVGSLVIGVPASFSFAHYNYKGRRLLFLLTLALTIFPGVVILGPLYLLLRTFHLIDTVFALLLPYLAYITPLIVWILTSYFKSIPFDLIDAARIDGASTLQTIWHVLVPLTLPGLFSCGLIAFISSWNEFLLALVFTQSNASRTVPVAISMFRGIHELNWSQMTTASIIATLPIVIIALLTQKYLISGLTAGALKG